MSTKATIAMGDGWHLFSCCWTGTTHIELNLDVHPDIDKLHIDRWPWLEVDDCESGEHAEIWLPDDVVAAIADYHCRTVAVTRAGNRCVSEEDKVGQLKTRVAELKAESEGRQKALFEKSEEVSRSWKRAEAAEAERDALKADADELQKYLLSIDAIPGDPCGSAISIISGYHEEHGAWPGMPYPAIPDTMESRAEQLRADGFDGLYNDECGCLCDDLAPCGEDPAQQGCLPGVRYDPPPEGVDFWVGPKGDDGGEADLADPLRELLKRVYTAASFEGWPELEAEVREAIGWNDALRRELQSHVDQCWVDGVQDPCDICDHPAKVCEMCPVDREGLA